MNHLETAWLAGLLEGEGNFEFVPVAKKAMDVRINLSMSDRDVVDRAAAVMEATSKVRIYDRRGQSGFRAHHKPLHCICVRGYRAIRVMTAVLPYMGERRAAKIRDIIKAWDGASHTRERHLPTTCHPDLPHYSKGLCQRCYKKQAHEARKDEINRIRREKHALIRAA